ncbi:MAG: hypothetical protein ACLFUW_07025 [Bacteroidales bacterium]
MIVHQNENVKITFDQSKKRLVQQWEGFASSQVFREGIDKTCDFVKKNNVKTIMSDTLRQNVVKPDDADYAASVIPTMVNNGLKAMAFVVPENVFTKLALDKFKSSIKGETTKYFMSKAEAEKWLDMQQ